MVPVLNVISIGNGDNQPLQKGVECAEGVDANFKLATMHLGFSTSKEVYKKFLKLEEDWNVIKKKPDPEMKRDLIVVFINSLEEFKENQKKSFHDTPVNSPRDPEVRRRETQMQAVSSILAAAEALKTKLDT
jgi:predicted lipoprotein